MPLNSPDSQELKAIVDWVNMTEDVRELSIKFGEVELFISRDGNGQNANGNGAQPIVAMAPAPAAAAPLTAPVIAESVLPAGPAASQATEPVPAASSVSSLAGSLAADETIVKAPMVGTFYGSPKPGDPPFVSVGDRVTASTVVGIVEVMKLMNNLEAKAEGTITQILVENEHAVEYGQPLMVIKRHA